MLTLAELGNLETAARDAEGLTQDDWWIGMVVMACGLFMVLLSGRIIGWQDRIDAGVYRRRWLRWIGTWDEKTKRPVDFMPFITSRVHVWIWRIVGAIAILFGFVALLTALIDME